VKKKREKLQNVKNGKWSGSGTRMSRVRRRQRIFV